MTISPLDVISACHRAAFSWASRSAIFAGRSAAAISVGRQYSEHEKAPHGDRLKITSSGLIVIGFELMAATADERAAGARASLRARLSRTPDTISARLQISMTDSRLILSETSGESTNDDVCANRLKLGPRVSAAGDD